MCVLGGGSPVLACSCRHSALKQDDLVYAGGCTVDKVASLADPVFPTVKAPDANALTRTFSMMLWKQTSTSCRAWVGCAYVYALR